MAAYLMSENGQLRPCTPDEVANIELLLTETPDQPQD